MRHSHSTKYAILALLSSCLIMLQNCGSKNSDTKHEEETLNKEEAADYYNGVVPVFRTPIPDTPPVYFVTETDCNDGVDNDGDGLVDCEDNDCHVHPECSEFGPPLEEIVNSRATTVYPNGLLAVEDVAIRNARPSDDDDNHDWLANGFFARRPKDCWIIPVDQDPYYFIPLGEAYIASPTGPVGPKINPLAIPYYGPRAGLINECEGGTDVLFHHVDDDNGPGAGAGGDTHINENDDDFGDNNDDNSPIDAHGP